MSQFKREKAIEAILFIATQLEKPTFHSISKMLYFADKMHLEQYGRLICDDTYIAMEYGPVPSGVYDMMRHGGIVYDDSFMKQGYVIKSVRNPDLDELSDSDIACLEAAIQQFGDYSFGQLVDITHQDSAWINAPQNGEMTIEDIVKMLDQSDGLLEYIHDPNP